MRMLTGSLVCRRGATIARQELHMSEIIDPMFCDNCASNSLVLPSFTCV